MTGKTIGFWICTALVVLSQGASGVMDFIQTPGSVPVEGMTQLGMPLMVLYVLGFWKIAGAICLPAPGLKRAKEWAYAGFFFDFTGAAALHAMNGDGAPGIVPPLILLGVLAGSYFLRPADRRLDGPAI